MTEQLPIISASRLKAARACQRLHHIQYGLGYRPLEVAETLRFGKLTDVWADAWWNAPPEVRLADALDALHAVKDADPFDLVKAEVMAIAYDTRWGGEALDCLGVEVEFVAPLTNPATGGVSRTWQLGGKIDAIVRKPDGRVSILERKTSSEDIAPGSDYWPRLRMDGQISTYFLGAAALGFDIHDCIYDVLKKPGQRPSQVPLTDDQGVKIVVDASGARVRTKDGKKWRESASSADGYVLQTRPETVDEYRARLVDAITAEPSAYLQRAEVVRLAQEMDEATFDTWQIAKQLREAELAGRFPRNPDACQRYGRTCEFFDVCTGVASLEDASKFRRSTHIHPELALASPQ